MSDSGNFDVDGYLLDEPYRNRFWCWRKSNDVSVLPWLTTLGILLLSVAIFPTAVFGRDIGIAVNPKSHFQVFGPEFIRSGNAVFSRKVWPWIERVQLNAESGALLLDQPVSPSLHPVSLIVNVNAGSTHQIGLPTNTPYLKQINQNQSSCEPSQSVWYLEAFTALLAGLIAPYGGWLWGSGRRLKGAVIVFLCLLVFLFCTTGFLFGDTSFWRVGWHFLTNQNPYRREDTNCHQSDYRYTFSHDEPRPITNYGVSRDYNGHPVHLSLHLVKLRFHQNGLSTTLLQSTSHQSGLPEHRASLHQASDHQPARKPFEFSFYVASFLLGIGCLLFYGSGSLYINGRGLWTVGVALLGVCFLASCFTYVLCCDPAFWRVGWRGLTGHTPCGCPWAEQSKDRWFCG